MAALYLHHALFASDASPPSSAARAYHDRQTSSFSQSVTLQTTSEYSHPREPLQQREELSIGSSAYPDLLTRQRGHPAEPQASANTGLSLLLGPITPKERKRLRERILRKELRRLSRGKWTCLGVIGMRHRLGMLRCH